MHGLRSCDWASKENRESWKDYIRGCPIFITLNHRTICRSVVEMKTAPNPAREEISELQSDVRNLKTILNRLNKSAGKFTPTDETTLASAIDLAQHIETKLETCVAALGTASEYDKADQRGGAENRDNRADGVESADSKEHSEKAEHARRENPTHPGQLKHATARK